MTPVNNPKGMNPPSGETSQSLPSPAGQLSGSRPGNAAPPPWGSASATRDHSSSTGNAAPPMGHPDAIHIAKESAPIPIDDAPVTGNATHVPGDAFPHGSQPGNGTLHPVDPGAWPNGIEDPVAHALIQTTTHSDHHFHHYNDPTPIHNIPTPIANLSRTSSLAVEVDVIAPSSGDIAPPSADTPHPTYVPDEILFGIGAGFSLDLEQYPWENNFGPPSM